MFLITATTTLCVTFSLYLTLTVLVDASHRIRLDRVDSNGSPIGWVAGKVVEGIEEMWGGLTGCCRRSRKGPVALEDDE